MRAVFKGVRQASTSMALPAFANRNPRYTIFLLFALVCSTFLLLPFRVPSIATSGYADYIPSKFRPAGVSLEEWLRHEEMNYAEVVKGRNQLIQKYGPDPAKVDP